MEGNQNPAENTNTQGMPNPQPAPVTQPVTAQEATSAAETKPSFELNESTILAALSYLGPLVIVPYLIKKDNPFVMFHIKQGILLLIPYLLTWVAGNMTGMLYNILDIINLVLLVLSVIGVINAVQSKEKELPLIGKFASRINL